MTVVGVELTVAIEEVKLWVVFLFRLYDNLHLHAVLTDTLGCFHYYGVGFLVVRLSKNTHHINNAVQHSTAELLHSCVEHGNSAVEC